MAELFRREGEGRCCARSTALLPAFAQWFTDGFLRGHAATGDPRRTDSPHTLDMCQLYGDREEVTACLRAFRGGRLKSRIVDGGEFPPALCEGGRIRRSSGRSGRCGSTRSPRSSWTRCSRGAGSARTRTSGRWR
ncbi:hypothetical protein ACFQ3Z_41020 [Streptomyces nogalater]